jgi:tRNA-dihydrouridine synthase
MVDATGRHSRYLIQRMRKRTTLWTPIMFSAGRLASRERRVVVDQMLRFHPDELPCVAQLGGYDRRTMLSAARKCQEAGCSGVSVDLGCPAPNAAFGSGQHDVVPDAGSGGHGAAL